MIDLLPENEFTFQFREKGARTRKVYEGSFTVKCLLSNEELVELAHKIDIYNRGSTTINSGAALINRAVAEAEVRVLKAPSWFKDSDYGRKLLDSNVSLALLTKFLDAEKSYGDRIEAEALAADEVVEKAAKKKKEKAAASE